MQLNNGIWQYMRAPELALACQSKHCQCLASLRRDGLGQRQLVSDVWFLMSCVWCLVSGVWCLVSSVWCLVSGVWYLVSIWTWLPVKVSSRSQKKKMNPRRWVQIFTCKTSIYSKSNFKRNYCRTGTLNTEIVLLLIVELYFWFLNSKNSSMVATKLDSVAPLMTDPPAASSITMHSRLVCQDRNLCHAILN